MKLIRTFSALMLAVSVFFAISAQGSRQDRTYPARSYIMTSTVTSHPTNGKPTLTGIRMRWVSIEGSWKEVLTTIKRDGTTHTTVRHYGTDGHYLQDNKNGLQLFDRPATTPPPEFRSTKFFRERRGLVGESSVLGFKTFVFRDPADEKRYVEKHYSPEVGINPLKLTFHDEAGDSVTEAISVEFVDVPPEDVAKPAGVPVNLDFLQQRIKSAEASGRHDVANVLRSVLSDFQRINRSVN